MSAVPPPGYPMTELGKIVFRGVRKQAAPSIRFSMDWWLRWFADGAQDREMQAWLKAAKAQDPSSPIVAAVEVLIQFGPGLVSANQKAPAEQEPASDYNVVPLVTTQFGWSVFRGQYDIPMADSEWRKVVISYLQWACRQIVRGNLGTRALDIAIHYMVLPQPNDRKYPNLGAPLELEDLAAQGWYVWKQATGGGEPMAIYGRASLEQWKAQHERAQQLDAVLGGAEKVLRYASMQEPILKLQEKLNEFGSKRDTVHEALQSFVDNEQAAAKALTPEELREVQAMTRTVYDAERNLYETLPRDLWDGEPPSPLAGLDGWLLVAGITGTIAVGLIAAVAASISALDTLIVRQRAMNLQGRIDAALVEMAQAAETQRENCRFNAGKIQDTNRRAEMIAQCDRDAQRTLMEIAAQRARVAEAAASVQNVRPQKAQVEPSALYIGLGIAAWLGLRWVRKRV